MGPNSRVMATQLNTGYNVFGATILMLCLNIKYVLRLANIELNITKGLGLSPETGGPSALKGYFSYYFMNSTEEVFQEALGKIFQNDFISLRDMVTFIYLFINKWHANSN